MLSALLAEGDLVLFDRNNHKAAHHGALFLGGAIPIFLETDRNAHGLIGPIFYEALDEARDPREDPQPSAGGRQGGVAARAAVPRRGDRAVHL